MLRSLSTSRLPRLASFVVVVACVAGFDGLPEVHGAAPDETAARILEESGVRGGLVVHVGCGDGRLTAALGAGEAMLVQGLHVDAAQVAKAREHVRSAGLYGKVSVDRFDGEHLPYRNGLVTLVVAEDLGEVSRDEAMRVLAPGGVLCVEEGGQWKATVKPRPESIDEWTHYLHGPGNNAVANDEVVGPPRGMQWLAGPQWSRNHHRLASLSSAVTAGGRLFYILDEATAANINVPSRWTIVARDAFSGVLLWKRPIPNWAWHQIRFRSGPPQVTRLLVATKNRLYVPLGLSAPVSAIDAASGETIATYDDTQGAEEMVLVGGVLVVLKGAPVAAQAFGHSAFREVYRLPNEKTILALDTDAGKTLWSKAPGSVMPETLASDGKRVFAQIDQGVACLDLNSGEQLWTYGDGEPEKPKPAGAKKGKKQRKRAPGMTFGKSTLVVADGVVLCKLGDTLVALDAEDGSKLWDCPGKGTGFHAPVDVFVIDGLVWSGIHPGDSISPPPVQDFSEGRDLRTGEVKVTNAVAVDLQTPGHHHRCYREKATCRFILTGKRGIELMNLAGDDHWRNNWVRGTCQYGILPANGLIYAPPHACGCYMEAKLRGFWALTADGEARDRAPKVQAEARLQRGPAFGRLSSAVDESEGVWPQYRHDPLRSGVADTGLPTGLSQEWKTPIGGRLTQPVVAEGKVVLASVDAHTVFALDEKTGKVLWHCVAGGRVDSPPAIYRGMVLFGSADGRVTCLRASDGELVWSFLAAPADVRTVAMGRVESLWPVHGSVLVLDGVAYCSAGRSTWLDGGIDLVALDPATGKVLHHTPFESRHPEYQEGKDQAGPEDVVKVSQNLTDYKTFYASDRSDAFSMAAGAVSDVMVSDGQNVYLHHVKFTPQLEKREELSRHLFSTSSLLDDSESHRSHWVLGTGDFSRVPVAYSWIANRPGKRMPTIAVPTGTMMVFDSTAVWGARRQGDSNGKYWLFKRENKPFDEEEKSLPDFRSIPADQVDRCAWRIDLPMRPTAMLKSGSHLLVGTSPVTIPEDDPHASYEGRLGGSLWICQENDGTHVAEVPLEAPPVWDGMAAAGRKLFVSLTDGSIVCLR